MIRPSASLSPKIALINQILALFVIIFIATKNNEEAIINIFMTSAEKLRRCQRRLKSIDNARMAIYSEESISRRSLIYGVAEVEPLFMAVRRMPSWRSRAFLDVGGMAAADDEALGAS